MENFATRERRRATRGKNRAELTGRFPTRASLDFRRLDRLAGLVTWQRYFQESSHLARNEIRRIDRSQERILLSLSLAIGKETILIRGTLIFAIRILRHRGSTRGSADLAENRARFRVIEMREMREAEMRQNRVDFSSGKYET
jgi:hypothetical protein